MRDVITTEERDFGYRSMIDWYVWEFVKKEVSLDRFKKIVKYIYKIRQDPIHICMIVDALKMQKAIYSRIGDRVGSRMMGTRLKWLEKEYANDRQGDT